MKLFCQEKTWRDLDPDGNMERAGHAVGWRSLTVARGAEAARMYAEVHNSIEG